MDIKIIYKLQWLQISIKHVSFRNILILGDIFLCLYWKIYLGITPFIGKYSKLIMWFHMHVKFQVVCRTNINLFIRAFFWRAIFGVKWITNRNVRTAYIIIMFPLIHNNVTRIKDVFRGYVVIKMLEKSVSV